MCQRLPWKRVFSGGGCGLNAEIANEEQYRLTFNRGAVAPVAVAKTRETIRLDQDDLGWFRDEVGKAGGGNYQSLSHSTG